MADQAPPFPKWTALHVAMVVSVMAICGAFFFFTGDADLFVAVSVILGAGVVAALAAQLHLWVVHLRR
jgi:hypothetical protein